MSANPMEELVKTGTGILYFIAHWCLIKTTLFTHTLTKLTCFLNGKLLTYIVIVKY